MQEAAATDPLAILAEVFGYASFRGQQAAIIEHASAGGDALVLMPTGGGKSLCYQVPAIARHRAGHGVSVVVSPLIALMHDQVGALAQAGVHAAFLNSTLDGAAAARVEREMMSGRLVLLYAAPERVTTERFLAMLDALHQRGRLSLFAIDEAHCVSQWGHDFRQEYLQLHVLHERFAHVPRIALTATADAHTQRDIVERLKLNGARQFIASFDRPNIAYRVVEKDGDPRRSLLRFLRDEHAGEAGIVYCATRRKVEETAAWLNDEGIAALPYHAGLDPGVRQRHQDRFVDEDGIVMVATIAFGMGIDKPDVRFVAHLDLPKTIESYYQETGRAGRDGARADAWMSYGLADVVNNRRLIDESEAGEEFKRLQRGKLDALLALAEAHDCRRARLLRYFDEASGPCDAARHQQCDNCASPPATWDATDAARKALSCIYRFAQHRGGPRAFGAVHLIDVLRGKTTDKVTQFGHERLSTFGIGADLSEAQWRAVLRQLVALRLAGRRRRVPDTGAGRRCESGIEGRRDARATRPCRADEARPQAATRGQDRSGRRGPRRRGAAPLRRTEGLAVTGGSRAQPAGVRGVPRRDVAADGARSSGDARRARRHQRRRREEARGVRARDPARARRLAIEDAAIALPSPPFSPGSRSSGNH